MTDFYAKYRDSILFFWGLIILTYLVFFHVVTDPEVYLILATAIGLPTFIAAARKSGNGTPKNGENNHH